MRINNDLQVELNTKYVSKDGSGIAGDLVPSNAGVNLGSVASKFQALYVKALFADSLNVSGSSVDMVDGYHASALPKANTLLALNGSGLFPASVLPSTVLTTAGGKQLLGDLAAAAGVKFDGVDISAFNASFDAHLVSTMHHSQAHLLLGSDHRVSGLTVGTYLRATSDSSVAFASILDGDLPSTLVRTSRGVYAGNGLTGGGALSQNVTLAVRAKSGLLVDGMGVGLDTPGTLAVNSANLPQGNHTHAITTSSNPSGVAILASDSVGGLKLFQLGLGGASPSKSGELAAKEASFSGDVVVTGNLYVNPGVFEVQTGMKTVFINKPTVAVFPSALVASPSAPNQGALTLHAANGQAANLLVAEDYTGTPLVRISPNGELNSGTYQTGVKGWAISNTGDAEFRSITARGELRTAVFTKNEVHVTGGTLAVMTAGRAFTDSTAANRLVADGNTMFIRVEANESDGLCPFAVADVLRIKFLSATTI